MAKLPKQKRLRFHKHKVRSGDTLSTIAESYRTSVKPIMYLNNLRSRSFIRAGSTLFVPVRGTKQARVRRRVPRAPLKYIEGTHIVRRGDTLWDLSIRFGVPVKRLLKWNKMRKSDKLMPGQRLYLRDFNLKEAKADDAPKG
jgi:membrane-bound lytic murein transglycosylase D